MNASSVKAAATEMAEQIAMALMPSLKRVGATLVCGDITGAPGHSLKINIAGRNAGLWKDWSKQDERARGIVDLVMENRNIGYREAIRWLAEFCGVSLEDPRPPKITQYSKPALEELLALTPESLIGQWLTERKIPLDLATAYGVYRDTKDRTAVMVHYYGAEACLVKAFYHPSLAKDNKCYSSKDPLHVLFGKPQVSPDTPTLLPTGSLLITEGQWDSLSYAACGIPAVSIPSGVENLQWLDNDWEYLQQFTTFYISFDMDGPGRKCAQAVASRLGFERCRNVKLPVKDANEMLCADRADELRLAVLEAIEFSPDRIKTAGEYTEQVYDAINKDPSLDGLPCLWPDFPYRIRMHESTTWTGYTSHGKSTFVQHLMAYLIGQSQRVCIASFESRPSETLACITKQIAGNMDPRDKKTFKAIYQRIHDMVDVYDDEEMKADVNQILREFVYAFQRHGVTQFVLDNAMCLSISRQDLDAQALAIKEFRMFVQRYPVHLHIVAHPRKPPPATGHPKIPNVHEIRGASEWADMAHNVVAIWRNLEKDDQIRTAIEQNQDSSAIEFMRSKMCDGIVAVGKQRHTGKLPQQPFFFDDKTKRFLQCPEELQHPY